MATREKVKIPTKKWECPQGHVYDSPLPVNAVQCQCGEKMVPIKDPESAV